MKNHRSETDNLSNDLGALAGTQRFINASLHAANVAMWNTCPDTGETWFSDIWYTMLGYPTDAFEPSFEVFLEMMHPDDHAPTLEAFNALVNNETEVYRADFRLRSADGSWRWIGATGSIIDRTQEGLPYLVCGMQTDISWRKDAEQALAQSVKEAREARERLTVLADNSPASLFEFRISQDGTATFPYITAGVLQLLAVDQDDVDADGSQIFRNIHEDDLPVVWDAIDESRDALSPFYVRYRVVLPDGSVRWIRASSLPKRLDDGATTWFGSVYDVTEEVERETALSEARDSALLLERQMRELALVDGLTGLPNRRSLDDHLRLRQTEARKPSGAPLAVLIRVDLDRFKNVNDTLGHDAGDAVLCHVSNILEQSVGDKGFAARTGGDEFSIILENGCSVQEAEAVVATIQANLRVPFHYMGRVCRFGASFGIATTENGSISSGDLMSFADAALYRAKQRGRNRLETFDNSLHLAIIESRRLAGEIEAGLENDEFEPFFQPQVCARTGELIGFEVLARWRSELHGLLTPDRFLPVAEQINVVSAIDEAMVKRTEHVVAQWATIGFQPAKLGFNVSAARLREPSMVRAVKGLQKTGITVSFELLESVLLEEQDDVIRQNLELIKRSGIELEVDDFGSGHASILGLLEIMPNTLKIDRRLTQSVEEDTALRALIRAVVGMARALDIHTIAEGIETPAQMKLMSDLGCQYAQGYLVSRPMDSNSVPEWVAARYGRRQSLSA
jgi:diguanylate cyclase (GGDEF)-like protein/PAS domain S-box-containing protein